MPISVVQINRERSLAGVAKRAYRIEGADAAEKTRRAEAALLAANPHLGKRSGFKPGAHVLVSTVPGLDKADEAISAGKQAGAIVETVGRSLAELSKSAADALAGVEQQADQTVKNLKSAKLRKSIEKSVPALVPKLPAIQDAAAKRADKAKARQAALATVLERAQGDLAKLSKTLE
jgi:hypothetical protein